MHLYVRADANSTIGTGHIMRCIALAQGWQDQGGEVTFISRCETEPLKQRIQGEGFSLIPVDRVYPDPSDLRATLSIFKNGINNQKKWLVLDGYHFTPDYQKAIREAGIHLLVIDDMNHLPHYNADILLNQNIHAQELTYHCDEDTIQLLGTQYVLLRREFLKYHNFKRQIPELARNILVTLGGADPNNVTLKIIESLQLLKDQEIEAKIVIGPANPNRATLDEALNSIRFKIEILLNSTNMPDLMEWANLVISAGGSTLWELAYMGLPIVILILGENQRSNAEKLHTEGISINLGWYEKISSRQIAQAHQKLIESLQQRKEMSAKGQKLIDGNGARKTIQAMMFYPLHLRPVDNKDCEWIWKWANEPEIREYSFSSQFIPWEEHVRWFQSKLSKGIGFYIGENSYGVPVGSIRFDKKNGEIVTSVIVACPFRGQGYGSLLIKMGTREFFWTSDEKIIHAYIKAANENSIRAFMKMGFRHFESLIIDGQQVVHFILEKGR